MSNDLQSILARHNLRGINVANFSTQRSTPQQHQPYQYPAPVPQPRGQYHWDCVGQSSSVRPSFAWPALPQPQYTIDPRHYSYDIWGKAPVYSLTGEDEEEEEGDDAEGEEEEVAEEEEGQVDAEVAAEAEQNIEVEEPAEDAATETIPEVTVSDADEKDIPPEGQNPDAADEQISDPPQEEASPATPPASEPPAEETSAVPTETVSQESEADIAAEPDALMQPEEEAHASEPAPSDIIDGMEPNHQDSGETIEAVKPSEGESSASEMPAPAESVEDVKQKDDNQDSSPKPAEEEQVNASQQPDSEVGALEANDITVIEASNPSSDEPRPDGPSVGDMSQENPPSHGITAVEQLPTAEQDASRPDSQSSGPTTITEEADETVTTEAPTASENIQDADSDEIVQVIDVNNNDSTDDTAAIIVVDVDASNATEDSSIPTPQPPPSPQTPHVTIAEPVRASKSIKKKPSSKSNKSRPAERPKERPVQIIPLRDGKVKILAKGKSKKKVKGKSGKVSEVDSGEVIPPPPPPIVDVPPPAPSPPPSGHVIEVVGAEEMQVIDETGEKDEGEDVNTVANPLAPDPKDDAGDTAAVEQPQVDHVPDEKEVSNNAIDGDATLLPGAHDEAAEVAQAADTVIVDQGERYEVNEMISTSTFLSRDTEASATESGETEQAIEAATADNQKQDDPSAAMSSPLELDATAPSLEAGDHVNQAEGPAETGKGSSAEPESISSTADPAIDDAPQDQPPEDSAAVNAKPDPTETTVFEAMKLDGAQSKDTSNDAPLAEPSTALEDKDNLLTEAEPPSTATEEANSSEEPSESNSEETDTTNNLTNDSTVDEPTPEPSIEPATVEESTSEILEKVATSEASEPNSPKSSSTDPATSGDAESSCSSEASAPVNGKPLANSAEVVAEPAPTLMELAALILPTDPVPQSTEDVAITNPESRYEAAAGDIKAKEPAVESDESDPVPEAPIGEDGGSKEEVAATDQENTVTASPDAPIHSEAAAEEANSECDHEKEDGKHGAPEETQGELTDGVEEPEVPVETGEPAIIVTNDKDSLQIDAEADQGYEAKVGNADENAAPVQMSNVEASVDAEPGQTMEAPKADDITPQGLTNVQEADNHDNVAPVEVATESAETAPTTLEEQAHGSDDSNANEPILEQQRAADAAETDIKDSPSSVAEGKDVVEAGVDDVNLPENEDKAQVTEEKASSDPADNGVTQVTAAPMAEPESGATQSPAAIHEDATEAREPARVPGEDSAVATEAGTEEITSQPVIEDVEAHKPAAEELPTEPDTEQLVADQAEEASEPCDVEPDDSAAREKSAEENSTNPSEPAAEENSSEQSVEAKADHIPEQPAETAEDATLSTTGAGTDPCQESPLPVLAEGAQAAEVTEALGQTSPENISESEKTAEATQPVDTAPSFAETPEPNEVPSPGQEPIPTSIEQAVEPPKPEDATRESQESPEEPQPSILESPEASVQQPATEAEVLPGDSVSQQSRCETIPDSSSGRRSPLIEQPVPEQLAPEEPAVSSPSKHSSKVSFDNPPISTKGKEQASPPRERRKSSKSSSSNRHTSSRHKVKDVSRPPSDQKSAPTSSRRRNSTTTIPQPGLFRRLSTTNSRSSRTEAAEHAEIRRRAAELAAREQEVQRQLAKARKRAALEEQERRLEEKEAELERLRTAEKEKKRARREEQKRHEQEALEQERLARERVEEEARAKEIERAERRNRRRESERPRHGDDRPRSHRHSSNREAGIRDVSPTAKPRIRRHRTEELGSERLGTRGEHDTREAPSSSRNPVERRHRRSSHRDPEKAERSKKSIWKSLLSKI